MKSFLKKPPPAFSKLKALSRSLAQPYSLTYSHLDIEVTIVTLAGKNFKIILESPSGGSSNKVLGTLTVPYEKSNLSQNELNSIKNLTHSYIIKKSNPQKSNMNLKDKDYSSKKETTVKIHPTKRSAESPVLARYINIKKVVRYLKLKKEFSKTRAFPEQWNDGFEARLKKFQSRESKYRRIAAPELIRLGRERRRSIGKGGGVGNKIGKLR